MKNNNAKKAVNKSSKGITLIALVITIIVLLILAGVSIAMLTGDNGILTQSQNAKTVTDMAEVKEQVNLDILNWRAERLKNKESTELDDATVKSIIEEANKNNSNKYYSELTDTSIITKQGNKILLSEFYEKLFDNIDTAETNPEAAMPTDATVIEADGSKGIVIKDKNDNEWVWVEVPKSIYTNTAYNGGTAPTSSEDYTKIEDVMKAYATDYRGSYTDTFYSTAQHGFADSTAYNNWKNAMLKSVYENGGFFIGKYEVGTNTARIAKKDDLTTPIIQQNAYPYNFVTCNQAQSLSKQLATGGKTSSLMFGIQWDLVLKFMEEKGYLSDGTTKVTQSMLKTDSGNWGNYYKKSFSITNTQAQGTTTPATANSWSAITEKAPSKSVLLTTGATDRNSILNIYDLAGNVYEWTLEYTKSTIIPCARRGGYYSDGATASSHLGCSANYSDDDVGFRPALY